MAAALQGIADDEHLSSEEERKQVSSLVERIECDAACSQLTIHWNEASGRTALIRKLHFRTGRHGRKQLCDEADPAVC